MRTILTLIAVGIAVALFTVVFAGPTAADQLVGPMAGTLALAGAVAGQAPHVLLVKGGGHKGGKHWGNNHWRFNHYGRWYGYPDYEWDSDSYGPNNQVCVWNGYSYTCYKNYDPY